MKTFVSPFFGDTDTSLCLSTEFPIGLGKCGIFGGELFELRLTGG